MTLEFPQGRIAQFIVSYHANTHDSYTVLGTEGSAIMSSAYMYGKPLKHSITKQKR